MNFGRRTLFDSQPPRVSTDIIRISKPVGRPRKPKPSNPIQNLGIDQ